MNKISSRVDWLLESCFTNCFLCRTPFEEPPHLDRNGRLEDRAFFFSIVVDKWGNMEETEERICNKCWACDLSEFLTVRP